MADDKNNPDGSKSPAVNHLGLTAEEQEELKRLLRDHRGERDDPEFPGNKDYRLPSGTLDEDEMRVDFALYGLRRLHALRDYIIHKRNGGKLQ